MRRHSRFGVMPKPGCVSNLVVAAALLLCIVYMLKGDPTSGLSTDVITNLSLLNVPAELYGTTEECNCNGENLCFPGVDSDGGRVYGRRFDCRWNDKLKEFGLLTNDILQAPEAVHFIDESEWTPTFVTAVSHDHYSELRMMLLNLMTEYPNSLTIVYDLGLRESEGSELRNLTAVEYRRFDFDRYPEHVKQLMNYTFKLVIIEALQTLSTFFYFDSSVRVKNGFHKEIIRSVQNNQLPPFMTFRKSIHSIYAATHPGMFEYTPISKPLTLTWAYQSTAFVSDSPYTRHVLRWWLLCAVTEDCVAPPGSVVKCPKLGADTFNVPMGCHRYDLSFWNIAQTAFLFDPVARGAQQLGLTAEPWPANLSQTFINDAMAVRERRLGKVSKPIDIKRDVTYEGPLPSEEWYERRNKV